MNEPIASPPASDVRPGGHVPALDAVRGIAILLVLGYHFSDFSSGAAEAEPSSAGVFRVLRQGQHGVDLFFVLSGFLITGILFDTKTALYYFRHFYIRRSLRIFPLYYGVLFVTFIALPLASGGRLVPYADSREHQLWLWLYGTNFYQAWHNAFPLSGFNHFWSLAVEEHFYLVWPLVIYRCPRRVALVVCGVCIAVATALRVSLAYAGYDVAVYTLTPCRMDALGAGALLALAVRGPGGLAAVRLWAYVAGALGALLLVVLYRWRVGAPEWRAVLASLRFSGYAALFSGLLIAALSAAPTSLAGRFWANGLLRFFGKYSYGLYVFHYLFLPLFRDWFPLEQMTELAGGSTLLGRVLVLFLNSVCSVIAALVSWNLFEKHFLKLKDVWARAPEPKPACQPAAAAVNA